MGVEECFVILLRLSRLYQFTVSTVAGPSSSLSLRSMTQRPWITLAKVVLEGLDGTLVSVIIPGRLGASISTKSDATGRFVPRLVGRGGRLAGVTKDATEDELATETAETGGVSALEWREDGWVFIVVSTSIESLLGGMCGC